MNVGESLKRFRKNLKLSQGDVAKKLGILQQSYSRYESGKFIPRADDIIKLADAYNVSTDYLLGRSDNPHPTNFDEREVKEAFAFRDAWQKAMQTLPQMTVQQT